jgi:hypothetical protein
MVRDLCLCADKGIILAYSENLCGKKIKTFYSILIVPFILCGLIFKNDFVFPSCRMNFVALVELA